MFRTHSFQSTPVGPPRRGGLACGLLGLALFVAIGWFAPNFVLTSESRTDPLGGDWLQEYTGGRMWSDPALRSDLYNQSAFRTVQHDAKVTGFSWDEKKYFPSVYPPFWYAAAGPLSQLDYLTSARMWLGLMIGCLVASLILVRRVLHVPVALLIVLALSPPVLVSLTSGQKGTLLLLIFTATFALFRSGKAFASGAVFALIAFKPHLALPIGLMMLVAGHWRWVLGTYFTLGILLVASARGGLDVCGGYVGICQNLGDYLQTGGYRLEEGFSLWSAAHMLVGDPGGARLVAAAISIVLVIATGLACRRALSVGEEVGIARAFAALTLATVLVAPHFYIYDLTILLLPAAILAREAMRSDATRRNWLPVGLIAVTLLGAPVMARFAAATTIQPGVLVLLAALLAVTTGGSESRFFRPFVRVDARATGH